MRPLNMSGLPSSESSIYPYDKSKHGMTEILLRIPTNFGDPAYTGLGCSMYTSQNPAWPAYSRCLVQCALSLGESFLGS